MNARLYLSLFAGLLANLSAAFADQDVDKEAILYAINEYVEGWRAGDVDRLSNVFDLDHGYVIWRNGPEADHAINSRTFRRLMEGRRPNAGYGDPYKILSYDNIGGQVAVVKFAVQTPKGVYHDLMTLMKSNGEWKITTKQFVYFAGEQIE